MNQDTMNAPVSELTGKTVVDPQGDKIGTVYDIYLDQQTDQPEWLALSTGMFGTKISFAPIEGIHYDGSDDLVLAYDKETVKNAPRVEADGQLSEQEERDLYAHYGRTYETGTSRVDTATTQRTTPTVDDGDASVVRSEEELSVDKHRQEAGRVRLRKYVQTENVQLTVPVQRQVARIVREDVSGSNVGTSGAFTEGEEEIVLSEEVVDVQKRVVAKERVGLETETVTDEVPVNETVRKERVEVEGDEVIDGDRRLS